MLCAEPGKGNVTSPVIMIPRTWFRAISDRESVVFEVSMNTPIPDEGPETDTDEEPFAEPSGEGYVINADDRMSEEEEEVKNMVPTRDITDEGDDE